MFEKRERDANLVSATIESQEPEPTWGEIKDASLDVLMDCSIRLANKALKLSQSLRDKDVGDFVDALDVVDACILNTRQIQRLAKAMIEEDKER